MNILTKKIKTVDNNKSFYFSASHFKAANQPAKKPFLYDNPSETPDSSAHADPYVTDLW